MKGFIIAGNRFWMAVLTLGAFLAVWHLGAVRMDAPLLLPTPGVAFERLGHLMTQPDFWRHLAASVGRGLTGFSLACISGVAVGLVTGAWPGVDALVRPFIVLVRSAPSISFIILALIWFKSNGVAIFVIFLVAFPIIVQNVNEGVRQLDRSLVEMVTVFRVRRRRQLVAFYLPAIWPYLTAGVTAGLGLTWKVVIAAEVLAYPQWGIGAEMNRARVYLETDLVFAWTLLVIGISLGCDYLWGSLGGRGLPPRKGGRDGQG